MPGTLGDACHTVPSVCCWLPVTMVFSITHLNQPARHIVHKKTITAKKALIAEFSVRFPPLSCPLPIIGHRESHEAGPSGGLFCGCFDHPGRCSGRRFGWTMVPLPYFYLFPPQPNRKGLKQPFFHSCPNGQRDGGAFLFGTKFNQRHPIAENWSTKSAKLVNVFVLNVNF